MSEIDSENLLKKLSEQMMAMNSDLTEEGADEMAKSLLAKALSGALSDNIDFSDIVAEKSTTAENAVPKPHKISDEEISPETAEKLDRILTEVDKKITPKETVRLKPTRGETNLFDSKMGGVPYFPKDMDYPTVREGKFEERPLHFIAQLNLAMLPKIEGFPTEGILQFYAGCDGDMSLGLDFDDGCNQNGFRVIYHENIIEDTTKLYSKSDMPEFDFEEGYYPFEGEFLLEAGEAEKMPVTDCDFRFWNEFLAVYNDLFGTDIKEFFGDNGLYSIEKTLCDAVCSLRNKGKTRMGGYAFFTQEDPRSYHSELNEHTILLFQSDSENGGDPNNLNDSVCWGDVGVANFFITPEDLEKRDFSHVLYNWDCC